MCIIGLDLDDTLTRPPIDAIDVAAKNLGIKRYDRVPKDYWFSTFSDAHRKEIFRLFETPEFMGAVLPIPRVQAKLDEWAAKHQLIIITAREEAVRWCTRVLVQRYFPMVSEVHFVHIREPKINLMRDLGIHVWIDDAPHGISCSLELKIPTYLVSNEHTLYNYEARKLLPNCRVVSNVAEVTLDKPCPWCGSLPHTLLTQRILDTQDFYFKFGCPDRHCCVQPSTEGLSEDECIVRWNAMEL